MKHAAYLFLLFLAAGCSVNSDLKGNKVRIEFRDSTSHVYDLVSVRDSTFVVRRALVFDTGILHTVPISEMVRVYHASYAPTAWALAGGAVGLFGTITTLVILSHGNVGGGEGLAVGGAIITLPVMILGITLGWFIPNHEAAYDPLDADDRESLKEMSVYPEEEPPEVQSVR
jgi:hypothetical protein